MKRILLTLCICHFVSHLFSQPLEVYAGEDVYFCVDSIESVQLGSDALISGGVPPYTYRWTSEKRAAVVPYANKTYKLPHARSTHFYNWDILVRATDYMNDTTLLSPTFFSLPIFNIIPGLEVYLTVEDSIGNTAVDTVLVGYGGNYGELLVYFFIPGSPKLGDVVTFVGDYHHTDFPPIAYVEWFPKIDDMLTSPYQATVDVLLSDVNYWYPKIYVTGNDDIGCSYSFRPYDDIQPPLGLDEVGFAVDVSVTQIQETSSLAVSSSSLLNNIRVFDVQGKLVAEVDGISAFQTIIPLDNKGIYLLYIETEDAESLSRKVIVQ